MRAEESRIAIIHHLRQALEAARARRGNYSIRRFARALGIASPVLVQVLNGKRNITRRLATQLLGGLEIDPARVTALLAAIPERQARNGNAGGVAGEVQAYAELHHSQLAIISEWWHYAILSLAETDDFQPKPEWIAKRLGISAVQAKRSIRRLVSLELLKPDSKTGSLRPTPAKPTTTVDIPSAFIRNHHRRALEMAIEKIHAVPVAERDYSTLTFAVARARIPEAKRRIERFRRQLVADLGIDARDEVYRIQIQLFPLSQNSKKPRKTREEKRGNGN